MALTYLFIPGSSEKKILKGLTTTADAVIIDLEDAVLPEDKEIARKLVYEIIQKNTFQAKLYVRINSCQTAWWQDDLKLLCSLPAIQGFMLPKSEQAEQIQAVARYLTEEQELIPLIESAKGVHYVDVIINASSKIKRLAFGSVDYALDMNVEWTKEGMERMYAMNALCIKSRAYDLEPPIDAVFPVLDDEIAYEQDILMGKQTGFWGKLVIHPKQIDPVKRLYKPSIEKVIWSQKVIDLYEQTAHGGAATLDGKLIDLPVYLLAKRLLDELKIYSS